MVPAPHSHPANIPPFGKQRQAGWHLVSCHKGSGPLFPCVTPWQMGAGGCLRGLVPGKPPVCKACPQAGRQETDGVPPAKEQGEIVSISSDGFFFFFLTLRKHNYSVVFLTEPPVCIGTERETWDLEPNFYFWSGRKPKSRWQECVHI